MSYVSFCEVEINELSGLLNSKSRKLKNEIEILKSPLFRYRYASPIIINALLVLDQVRSCTLFRTYSYASG